MTTTPDPDFGWYGLLTPRKAWTVLPAIFTTVPAWVHIFAGAACTFAMNAFGIWRHRTPHTAAIVSGGGQVASPAPPAGEATTPRVSYNPDATYYATCPCGWYRRSLPIVSFVDHCNAAEEIHLHLAQHLAVCPQAGRRP